LAAGVYETSGHIYQTTSRKIPQGSDRQVEDVLCEADSDFRNE